jgi:hypothetical protein
MNSFQRKEFIERMIANDVIPQIKAFERLNDRISELIKIHGNDIAAIRVVHQSAPHVVSTRKHTAVVTSPVTIDPSNPIVEIDLGPELGTIGWNSLSCDSIAENFAAECENDSDGITAGDILFLIMDRSYRHRQVLFFGPQGMPKKATTASDKPMHAPIHVGCNVSEDDVCAMDAAVDDYETSILTGL